MKYFKQVRSVAITQLFASIPKEYKAGFKKQIYNTNMDRFTTQCLVLVLMDFVYLVGYLIFFDSEGTSSNFHINLLCIKIVLMFLGYFYFTKISKKISEGNILRKYMDIIYPSIHFVLEFLLFYSGPQSLSYLIRLSAVPFICGSIPIIKQGKAFILESAIYFSAFLYLPHTIYNPFFNFTSFIINIWFVVFICANLVSFIVYSAQVQNYKLGEKEIASRKKVEDLLKQDELTKVNNRRMISTYLNNTWNDRESSYKSLSVIILDIDNFKALNDTYGHKQGDKCLVRVASETSKIATRHQYEMARYGGEEFIMLAYDKDHMDSVNLAEEIRVAIENLRIPNINSNTAPHVTVSMGVSTQTISSAQHYSKIIEWADECLYFAKNAGRNRVAHREDQRSQYRLLGASSEKSSTYGPMLQGHNVVEDFNVDYAFIYYSQKNIMNFSNATIKLLDLPPQIEAPILENLRKYIFIPESDMETFNRKVASALKRKAPFFTTEFRVKNNNGSYIWIAVSAKCIYTSSNKLEAIYGSAINIEKLEDYQNYLHSEKFNHPITNLPDRQLFRKTINETLGHIGSNGYILILDIDDFKAINGFFGHSTGNKVLINLSEDIRNLLNMDENLFHYGPDQFVVLFKETTSSRVQSVAETVLIKYHNSILSIGDSQIDVSLTATAFQVDQGTEANDLYVDMDIAIQVAKKNYPREFSFFTDKNRTMFLDEKYLENNLRKAIDNDFKGFALFYQPLIDGKTNVCAGAEALLRWKNADGDIISPLEVIPALERTNLITKVEQWVIRKACEHCARFKKESGNENFFVNINLAPSIMDRDTLVDEVVTAIDDNNLSKNNLFCEVTESSPLEAKDTTMMSLQSLRRMGVKIAIDDFGTGFSSLSYLKTFPVDGIKIDRTFIQDSDSNLSSKELLYAIIQLTKSMGYQICVEGVQTSAHHELLKDKGVDYFQGFYFGRPISLESFIEEHIK